jgi:uncharacterized protein (TIGR03435 family)
MPAFEVASVKPSPPPGPSAGFATRADGGPGTPDPTRIDYRNLPLSSLIGQAYGLDHWQLSAPEWMAVEKYDIAAKVPPGATEEQFRLMLQRLLAERFKLRVHRGKQEMPMYSLTAARSGPRLKSHAGAPPVVDTDGPKRPSRDSNGYPILPLPNGMMTMGGKSRLQTDDAPLAQLARYLSSYLGAPVRDDTGLEGKYDIGLFWVSRDSGWETDSGPDLFAALQEQLGLKLEKKKGPVEILAIDHAEKVPTGN